MEIRALGLLGGLGWVALAAHAEDRLPTIPPAAYSAEQKQAAAEFEASRKVAVFGPFEPLMHSPQVMSEARAMGDYLRYKSAIGNTLSELAILVTAREWTPEIIDTIAEGRRPAGMGPDEEIVYECAIELIKNKQVSNATFDKAKAHFGTKGVFDLTGIVGYYTFLAMQLNVAQYPAPKDAKKLSRMPP